jgi:hypothetical protein
MLLLSAYPRGSLAAEYEVGPNDGLCVAGYGSRIKSGSLAGMAASSGLPEWLYMVKRRRQSRRWRCGGRHAARGSERQRAAPALRSFLRLAEALNRR